MNFNEDLEVRWLAMTQAQQGFVRAAHVLLREIKTSPETFTRENVDPVQLIEDIEFALQGVWKFTRNPAYHTHKWEISGCTCPKLDNAERFGSPYKIINEGCKWHSVIK